MKFLLNDALIIWMHFVLLILLHIVCFSVSVFLWFVAELFSSFFRYSFRIMGTRIVRSTPGVVGTKNYKSFIWYFLIYILFRPTGKSDFFYLQFVLFLCSNGLVLHSSKYIVNLLDIWLRAFGILSLSYFLENIPVFEF